MYCIIINDERRTIAQVSIRISGNIFCQIFLFNKQTLTVKKILIEENEFPNCLIVRVNGKTNKYMKSF